MKPIFTIVMLALAATTVQAHEHHAPHKGTLVELGEEFSHLEIVLDPASGKITAYALDGEAEKAVRLKQAEIVLKITGVKGPNAGKTFPAIYELTADTLRVCYDLSGKKRPTEFATKPGTKLYLVTYKRKKK